MTEPIDRLILLLTPNSSSFVTKMLERSVCNPHSFVQGTGGFLRNETLLTQASFLAMTVHGNLMRHNQGLTQSQALNKTSPKPSSPHPYNSAQ